MLNCCLVIAAVVTKLVLQLSVEKMGLNWQVFVDAIIGVYCLGVVIVLGILASLHCVLVAKNQTTNEYFKDLYVKNNPYSKGCFRNFLYLWCPPYYPNYINFREEIVESDTQFVPLTSN